MFFCFFLPNVGDSSRAHLGFFSIFWSLELVFFVGRVSLFPRRVFDYEHRIQATHGKFREVLRVFAIRFDSSLSGQPGGVSSKRALIEAKTKRTAGGGFPHI